MSCVYNLTRGIAELSLRCIGFPAEFSTPKRSFEGSWFSLSCTRGGLCKLHDDSESPTLFQWVVSSPAFFTFYDLVCWVPLLSDVQILCLLLSVPPPVLLPLILCL